jgi:hypothetical protein
MSENVEGYYCKVCNKKYASASSLWNHNKKFHNDMVIHDNTSIIHDNTCKKYKCLFCNKIFNNYQNRWKHNKICKNNKIITLEKENTELKNKIIPIQQINNTEQHIPINNQLINIIVDKTNTINKLITKIDENKLKDINSNNIIPNDSAITLNNVIITSRSSDNYINATQLCKAGDKRFNDWFYLDSTKQLINELINDINTDISSIQSDTGNPVSQFVDIKKSNNNLFQQDTWIHPDLAIQLAQWISPKIALQVSKWIRSLFINENVSLDKKNNEIKMKDSIIQLLKDTYIQKQQRINYPENNVIYILTTEDNKNKRIYIVGKAKNLKNRLSTYNKTAEHEVVYYKSCESESKMNIIEHLVLFKLRNYKEKANRDRYILPQDKDISYFTNIIDTSIKIIS